MDNNIQYLSPITTDDTLPISLNISNQDGGLFLQYRDETNNLVIVDCSANRDFSAPMSVLDSLLRERDWNLYPRLVLDKKNKLGMIFDNQDKAVPDITGSEIVPFSERFYKTTPELEDLFRNLELMENLDFITNIKESYEDLILQKNRVDEEETNLFLPVLERISSYYINTINTSTLVYSDQEGNLHVPHVSLQIAYTKNQQIGGLDIDIIPFRPNNSSYEENNSIYELEDVVVEVLEGTIRVFPNNGEVTECVIQGCEVAYEY